MTWIKVSDRPPSGYLKYLVYEDGEIFIAEAPQKGSTLYWHDDCCAWPANPTHWQPLPEPPNE